MTLTITARRRARLAVGVTAGAALALALPLAASAHVHVTPEEVAANGSTRIDFSFSHGCDGSPTTALVVDIPAEAQGATPVIDGAWTITTEAGENGIPTRVTYTAVAPIPDAYAASAGMNVIFPGSAEGESFAFPVTQQCEAGEAAWVQVAEDGQDPDDLEYPAPVVVVGAAAADAHGGHSESGHSSAGTSDAADAEATAAAAPAADPLPIWLSAGALVLAAAALVLAITRRRA
ncbi:DUF1775 domain-containing protein [Microbacterium sp. NE2HP2]|uniref:DUF1775 domain-containing protein n=1 Tax=Microbacterium TaxID=33882 RepID=UPI00236678AB|nr:MULTISPECIES: DUF1775 domain-containing protein [Microbacterium]MDD7944944.1 DUF1775 domain-containing protein [Microbacterium plantarum]WHE35344.1 DUF1775 domain-containing protein [Microbacterium sp. BDGP8]WRK16441.1 DUF1775 domain-containing protein [Microbacterium plantarum]